MSQNKKSDQLYYVLLFTAVFLTCVASVSVEQRPKVFSVLPSQKMGRAMQALKVKFDNL